MMKKLKIKMLHIIVCTIILLLDWGSLNIPRMVDHLNPASYMYNILPITSRNVYDFVRENRDKEVLIVDKENHLLYYLRHGQLVRNDYWNGRYYSFPLPIAIGMGGFYKTPEGTYKINGKNPYSRYTKFLRLNIPYSIAPYGIHAGPTYLAKKYEKLELQNPGGRFVTKKDDTRGCVAVETLVMKYLFEKIGIETPVLIY